MSDKKVVQLFPSPFPDVNRDTSATYSNTLTAWDPRQTFRALREAMVMVRRSQIRLVRKS